MGSACCCSISPTARTNDVGKAREFTTAPVRAIGDKRLTALELRVLLVIAEYDGMSLVKGSGSGCYAKLATLAERLQTDISNLSKAVSRLAKLGYVLKERQNDGRRSTLRVIYEAGESWRAHQQSPAGEDGSNVGEFTNNPGEMVGEFTNDLPEIVGDEVFETRRNLPKTDAHYIPLKGELDLVETRELNSSEEAQRELFAPRATWEDEDESGSTSSRLDAAEAGHPGGVSILARLTKHFAKLGPDAQLCRFEDEFRAIGRDVGALPAKEREHWTGWLLLMAGGQDAMEGSQAWRLYEEVASCPFAPADLSLADLRRWTKATIDALGYGGQTHLADQAGVPQSTLHGFRHGKPLPDQYRAAVRGACASVLPFNDWKAQAA